MKTIRDGCCRPRSNWHRKQPFWKCYGILDVAMRGVPTNTVLNHISQSGNWSWCLISLTMRDIMLIFSARGSCLCTGLPPVLRKFHLEECVHRAEGGIVWRTSFGQKGSRMGGIKLITHSGWSRSICSCRAVVYSRRSELENWDVTAEALDLTMKYYSVYRALQDDVRTTFKIFTKSTNKRNESDRQRM